MKTLFVLTSLIVVLFLSASSSADAQERSVSKKEPPKANTESAAELTAEQYRDLIVNTADAMNDLHTYAKVSFRTGSEMHNGRLVDCLWTFTVTESEAQDVAKRRKTWENARVPKALAESHSEIMKWMASAEETAKAAPKCFLPLLQASQKQYDFLEVWGAYKDLRKHAAEALAGMSVKLPPIEEAKPAEKK